MDTKIINARIVTNDEIPVIAKGQINIKDGIITYVGEEKEYKCDKTIDAKGNTVMPGFVNTHTHIPMNIFRSFADDMELMDWLQNKIWPAEDKLTEEITYHASMMALCEMAAAGITAFNEMYYFTRQIAQATIKSKLRAVISRAVVTPDVATGDDKLKEAIELFEEFNGFDRLQVYLSPHAQYTVNNQMLQKIAKEAKRLNTGIHMHISETLGEHQSCIAQEGLTPVELCEKMGLLDVNFLGAHCVYITHKDMDIMAKHKASVLSCPKSNLKLASGIAPLSEMIERGVNVSLGTDGASSNNKLSIMEEMTYASYLQKGTTKNPKALNAQQSLLLATYNGAQALGINSGKIKVGKNADLIMINSHKLRYLPHYDIISNLVYSADDNDVMLTMVGGDVVYENGKFAFADIEEVKEKIAFYAKIMKN